MTATQKSLERNDRRTARKRTRAGNCCGSKLEVAESADKDSVCSFEGIKLHKSSRGNEIILDSSMVEHTAVNRGVVGSSPTRGVKISFMKKSCRRNRL